MIWVTGDIHGDPSRLSSRSFDEQEFFEKQDEIFLIILGDFGLVWNREKENSHEKWWLNWLEDKPFTTLFIDGNHENYDRLDKYPVSEWNGGKRCFIWKEIKNGLRNMQRSVIHVEIFQRWYKLRIYLRLTKSWDIKYIARTANGNGEMVGKPEFANHQKMLFEHGIEK